MPKSGNFSPAFLGSLTPATTICKDKDNILAKYSLESSAEPLAVSEYELAKLYPVDFKSSLPTIEEIESELK